VRQRHVNPTALLVPAGVRLRVSDMPTGKRYSYARIQAPLGNWDVNFPALTDANLATMEAFFAQQQGRLQPFTFLDPAGNLEQYSDDFSQSAWVKATLTLGAAVADPFGGTGATSITGTGANSHMSCYVLPDGGASGFTLCGSVWAKAAGAGQPLLIALTDDTLAILGSPVSQTLPQGSWVRIFFGFTLASADKIKLLIGGFNSWSTSQVISPFGAQCAPTLGRLREDARKPRATLELPLRYGPLRGAG